MAHIYPLNPREEEAEELSGLRRLHSDVNHSNNLIPLCIPCHSKYDKPRTKEEYLKLVDIKEKLMLHAQLSDLQSEYPIEADIRRVVERLHSLEPPDGRIELTLIPRKVEHKFDGSLPNPTRQKIRNAVKDYFHDVRSALKDIERDTPNSSQLISTQIRSFYLKQKVLGVAQPEVFRSLVEWIRVKTEQDSVEAAEIVVSFFVQNCEVFE